MAERSKTGALALAMQAESKAVKFYMAKAGQTKDLSAKTPLNRLAEMEKAHYQILQAELHNINPTGLWMGIREISFEMS